MPTRTYDVPIVSGKSSNMVTMDKIMNTKRISLVLAIVSGLIFASSALADPPKVQFPTPSPACTLKQHVGLTDIEVDYSRPGIKGREIYGGLVPYGQVWRTGANEATKIIFSTPVKLNGTAIAAGTYALFTIPGKDEWTVIINKGAEQWGAYKYDEKDDVARFKATPIAMDHAIETFTIEFNQIKDDSSLINLVWDRTVVPIKLEVDIVDKVTSQIDEVMASDAKKKPYYQAALFYYNHGLDLKKASQWVDAAISEREAFPMYYLKAEILAKLGDKAGAMIASKRSTDLAVKANDPGYVKLNADLMSTLK
jgi:hypothetical protein